MNELALFTGIGGGILGTYVLGINTVCAVERDKHCRYILSKRQNERALPPFPIWDDVCTFAGTRWRGTIDIISGGFPCQAFSTAAHGRNTAANLWPEMRRIIREVEPTYVFAENVATRAIEQAAKDCSEMGYKTEMLSISAKDLGADHIRERYWLLAYANDKSQLRSTINAKVASFEEFCQGIWETNPAISGMVDGLSSRMERYTATGNAQVPVVAAAALWSLANA
jgi:DNA (cytosine-5)-methyltransferase 1